MIPTSLFNPSFTCKEYRNVLVVCACRVDDFLPIFKTLKAKLRESVVSLLTKEEVEFNDIEKLFSFSEAISWQNAETFSQVKYNAVFCFVAHASDTANMNLFWFLQRMVNTNSVQASDCFVVDVRSTLVMPYLKAWHINKKDDVYCSRTLGIVLNPPFVEESDLKENAVLHNKHYGQRCFICASGPSVKEQDLSLVKDDVRFALNFSFYHDAFKEKPPDYYLCAHMSYEDVNTHIDILEKQDAALAGTEIFYSYGQYGYHNARELIEQYGFFKNNRVYYLRYAGQLKKDMNLEIDLTKSIPTNRNSVISVITVALYMGFKEIHLLGCESDMLHHDNGCYHHFYDNNEVRCTFPYGEILKFTYHNWIAFHELKKVAERRGTTIYNATPDSKLDMFDRVVYEDVIGKPRKIYV